MEHDIIAHFDLFGENFLHNKALPPPPLSACLFLLATIATKKLRPRMLIRRDFHSEQEQPQSLYHLPSFIASSLNNHFTVMSDKFFQMPELAQQLSHYLNNPTLFVCIQVSRAWHTAFISHLWHTINDRREPWVGIIADLDADHPKYSRDVVWFKQAIANNGQHIRHLSVGKSITLEACVEATSCTGITHLTLRLEGNGWTTAYKNSTSDPALKSETSIDIPVPTQQPVFSFKPLTPPTPSSNASGQGSCLRTKFPAAVSSSAFPQSSMLSFGSPSTGAHPTYPSTSTSPANSFTFGVTTGSSQLQLPFTFGLPLAKGGAVPEFSLKTSVKPVKFEDNTWQQFVIDVPSSIFLNYKTAPEKMLKDSRYAWQLILQNKNLQEILNHNGNKLLSIVSKQFLKSTLRGLTQIRALHYLFTEFDVLEELPDIAPRLETFKLGTEFESIERLTRSHKSLKCLSFFQPMNPKQVAVLFERYPHVEKVRFHLISTTNDNPVQVNSQHLKIWSSSNPAILLAKHVTIESRNLTQLRFTDVLGLSQLLQILIKFPNLETFKTTNLIRNEKISADTVLETEELIASFQNLGIGKPTTQAARRFHLKNLTIWHVTGPVDVLHDPLAMLWPSLPYLERLSLQPFPKGTFSNIVTHCPKLQHLDASLQHRCSKEIAKLLTTCSELVSFTGDRHTVNAYDIIDEEPWVCRKMEKLDLEIIGVRREVEDGLTGCIDYHFRMHYSELPERERISQLEPRKKEQVDAVYKQLSLLTQLKHLKLGAATNPYATPEYQATYQEKRTIKATNVYLPDSLELTLNYGLELLGPLKRLKSLDVKGMNHRMTEKDLDWLLQNCPCLKTIRGLKGWVRQPKC